MSYITTKIRMANVFVIFNFQPTFRTQCEDTFMFHLRTKFNKRCCSTSRVTTTKLKTKQNGHTAAILLLHSSQKYYSDKKCTQNLLPHIISGVGIKYCQRSYSLVSSLVRHVVTSECTNLKTKVLACPLLI